MVIKFTNKKLNFDSLNALFKRINKFSSQQTLNYSLNRPNFKVTNESAEPIEQVSSINIKYFSVI